MSDEARKNRLCLSLLALASVGLIFIVMARAQDPPQEDERRLWDSEFLKKRGKAKTPPPDRKSTAYRRVTPKNPPPENKPAENKASEEKVVGEMLGVTIWRVRPSRQSDSQEARLLVEEEEGKSKAEGTLERVDSETTFAAGDRVRLALESPRDGYLYVIDREQYNDGTFSDPYLIFPTLRKRNGDNSVTAGKVIEIPERSTFGLKPQRKDYAGEILTVIVTQQPLSEVSIGSSMVKLDRELFARWEKQWSAPVERFDLMGGAGKLYTKVEKEAGQDGARLLTQEDELPQTLYRIVTRPGNPLLINVSLRIGK
ncbi:MAG: DUF4384 domain-containing protein [Acidobacteria bacterium]|nr:DUF4384 domain-containing protein [Acidobacteriota bacterium]MCI0660538.1 DUF4384 domain-containing protein [Acidobacteriota bacterium]